MRPPRSPNISVITLALAVSGCGGQTSQSSLVVSSDPELAVIGAELLPRLAERAGMDLSHPVRIEARSRAQLVSYLRLKLDEDLPEDEARARRDTYALLGLVEPDLGLRNLLLGLYTEQVAGFYDPDSTALFVLDDQPEAALEGLLLHELVHAVQDQNVRLDELVDPDRGNDAVTAAQAAIEGHATLVMFEYLTEQAVGSPIDLSQIPDFESQVRPALAGVSQQFPALADAPRIIRESLLFPYVEGAIFVQRLWADGERHSPFGPLMPGSTEQVVYANADRSIDLSILVDKGKVILQDGLGAFELQIFLEEVLEVPGGIAGEGAAGNLAAMWDGDHYVLVESSDGDRHLVWVVLWSDEDGHHQFTERIWSHADNLGGTVSVERIVVEGRSATLLQIGGSVDAIVERAPSKS